MNTPKTKITAAERHAAVIARLEALEERQQLRLPRRRQSSRPKSERTKAMESRLLEDLPRSKAREKRRPLREQVRTLIHRIVCLSVGNKRRSLRDAVGLASVYRISRDMGSRCGVDDCYAGLPPRTRETNPAMRALDRGEALLLRLVSRGVEKQLEKRLEAELGTGT